MTHRITSQMIEDAKKITKYRINPPLHEHDDCIRMCYEWLDAQKETKQAKNGCQKGLVECWAGRYVSTSDFSVAVTLHPRFYQNEQGLINISKNLIEPSRLRLEGLSEAMTQFHKDRHTPYNKQELRILRRYQSVE